MGVDTGRLRVVAAQAATSHEPRAPRKRGARGARSDAKLDPDTLGADGFDGPGPYIKAQRKRKGMTLEQLALATKIPRAQLELLEADRYDELPGMVFAKGFLRCCARSLELDPDAVLGLLYERERVQLQARRREPAETKTRSGRGAAISAKNPVPPRRKRAAAAGRGSALQAQVARWLDQLPSARILMWIVVALLVALVVFIAFTLASSQAETLMIRS